MRFLIIIFIAISLVGCKSKKNTVADKNTTGKNETVVSESITKVILDPNFDNSRENASFDILEASISGDILTLTVSYGGGCQEHQFNAYFNGIYMKSLPPKATIYIEHINNGDNCRKIVEETLRFDLSAVKYPGHSSEYTVMLGMNNYKDFLEYKY